LSVIQLAVTLVTTAGVSFRGVSKVFIHLNLCLRLNLDIPTHTTVLNWTKKQGISQFMSKDFYQHQKWVLIADESIQFGNKKLLLILAVPEDRCRQGRALSYKDITPLVLKVGSSWKAETIASEIKNHITLEQISYCVSDAGSNLTCAFKLLNHTHIHDVNHAFSLIIKSVYENNSLFNEYTKSLSLLRAQKSMSKIARIVPPNQRIMSRFMNLMPLFEWGMKMIDLLANNQLDNDEKDVLSFLETYKEFIFESYQVLVCLNEMQTILKINGFNAKSTKKAKTLLSDMKKGNSLKIRNKVEEYLRDIKSKAKGKTICCSSDIIESCMSKYKSLVKGNKSVGISDLSLCVAAMMGISDLEKTAKAMETVKIKQVKEWKAENVSKTLFAEKIELNKKLTEIII